MHSVRCSIVSSKIDSFKSVAFNIIFPVYKKLANLYYTVYVRFFSESALSDSLMITYMLHEYTCNMYVRVIVCQVILEQTIWTL